MLFRSFPNPDREEWNAKRIRQISSKIPNDLRKILVAHFLRIVHPFNSFLVPQKKHLSYNGKNIGEEPELINYVKNFLTKEFKAFLS